MDDELLDLTVRQLLERAGSTIARKSLHWPDYECRVDLYHNLHVRGKAIHRAMGVQIPITIRVKITAVCNWDEHTKAEG